MVKIDADMKMRIAKVANVFGCLKRAIFTNQGLSLDIKRAVYKAVVLATLLVGQSTGQSRYITYSNYKFFITDVLGVC